MIAATDMVGWRSAGNEDGRKFLKQEGRMVAMDGTDLVAGQVVEPQHLLQVVPLLLIAILAHIRVALLNARDTPCRSREHVE